MTEVLIRRAEQEGYQGIISVVDEWRGGRPMAAVLPQTLPGPAFRSGRREPDSRVSPISTCPPLIWSVGRQRK